MSKLDYTRRDFLKTMGLGAAALAVPGCVGTRPAARRQGAPRQANIILIMADDMGFSDLGCYGGEIHTPNIDRLAAGGIRFSRFYNAARCCPTRASILIGLYPHQAGMGGMVSQPELAGELAALYDAWAGRCGTLAVEIS